MITYKNGNLLDATEDIIAHGCNDKGVMGAGVALAIKNKWPKAYVSYKLFCDDRENQTGIVHWFSINPLPQRWIANCIIQQAFGSGKQVSYDAVDDCMIQICNSAVSRNPVASVAMPKIGAGLGGGNWEVIEAIINHRLACHVPVVIYCL